jgi:hypothetical protein
MCLVTRRAIRLAGIATAEVRLNAFALQFDEVVIRAHRIYCFRTIHRCVSTVGWRA